MIINNHIFAASYRLKAEYRARILVAYPLNVLISKSSFN